jgi:hypothetical protein
MPDPATPNPGLPASPGPAPIGVSPVTQSTPNKGYEMAGLQGLALTLKLLEAQVPKLGATSEAGKDVLKCINILAKHVQPGAVSPAAQRNELMNQMMKQQQGQQQASQLRQQMAKPAAPSGPMPGASASPTPMAA